MAEAFSTVVISTVCSCILRSICIMGRMRSLVMRLNASSSSARRMRSTNCNIERGLILSAAAVLTDRREAGHAAGDLVAALNIIFQVVPVVHIARQLCGQMLSLLAALGIGFQLC